MKQEKNSSLLFDFIRVSPLSLFLFLQLMIVILGGVALFLTTDRWMALSYLVGSMLLFVNLLLLSLIWALVIEKKLIALSATIIVFKYALLGAIVYKVLKLSWVSTAWFAVGLSSLTLTVLLFALIKPFVLKQEHDDDE